MREWCIDASVAIKWIVETERDRDRALALLKASISNGIALISAPLFPYEVDSYVRQRVHNGSMTQDEAATVFRGIDAIKIEIVESSGLRQRTREISERFNQRLVYDSLYAALADLRGCDLWTADTRFHRVVAGDMPFVKHISNFEILDINS